MKYLGVYASEIVVIKNNKFFVSGADNPAFGSIAANQELVFKNNTFYSPAPGGREIINSDKIRFEKDGEWITIDSPYGSTYSVAKVSTTGADISANNYQIIDNPGPRRANFIDVPLLRTLTTSNDEAVIRPKHPPTNLIATINSSKTVSLTWNASVDNNVVGYRVRWGRTPGSQTNTLDVGNKTNASITNLPNGTWYFSVSAYKPAFSYLLFYCIKINITKIASSMFT